MVATIRKVGQCVGLTACLLPAVAQCGGRLPPPPPPCSKAIAPLQVRVGAVTFTAQSVTLFVNPITIIISPSPFACYAIRYEQPKPVLRFDLTQRTPDPLRVRVFRVDHSLLDEDDGAQAYIDDLAGHDPIAYATGGTITIDSYSNDWMHANVTGTYDVTFADGSRFAGAFDAPLCANQCPANEG